ncbi:MAG: AraC family transcriptional regulator [Polyangiales bacterium]
MPHASRPEIERALRFIAAQLTQPITAADVARAAHLSEFHLHRVFHAEVGESIGRFITRRRLELAALRLAYEPDRSITDIALSSGYSSSSNFSKAFAGFFGVNPRSVRERQAGMSPRVGKLMAQYGKPFEPDDLYTCLPTQEPSERAREAATWNAAVRFETVDTLPFACLASTDGYDYATLETTWNTLIDRARQLGLCQEDVDAWGIAHDSPQLTAPELCRYHASVPCPPGTVLPAPLFAGERSAGRYAVFHYSGAVSGVADAYRSIYSCWFPEASIAPDNYEPLDHYITDAPKDGQVTLELWFKTRTRRD